LFGKDNGSQGSPGHLSWPSKISPKLNSISADRAC
jgi:hypothetical protein